MAYYKKNCSLYVIIYKTKKIYKIYVKMQKSFYKYGFTVEIISLHGIA